MAIFLESLNDREVMRELKFQNTPIRPNGFSELYESYKRIKDQQDKLKAWKDISEKFGGYIKAIEKTEAQNMSNKLFLNEMLLAFEREGMENKTLKVRTILNDYQE